MAKKRSGDLSPESKTKLRRVPSFCIRHCSSHTDTSAPRLSVLRSSSSAPLCLRNLSCSAASFLGNCGRVLQSASTTKNEYIFIVSYLYIYIYIHTHVFMYVCMYVCMYAWMYVCMYVCMHVCMYACMSVCMPLHTHTHASRCLLSLCA